LIAAFLFSLRLVSVWSADDHLSGDPAFDFYYGDFLNFDMKIEDPLAVLITHRLAEAVFSTTDGSEFKKRIQFLLDARQENPDKLDRFVKLDRILETEFDTRLKQAKQKRILYSEVGAVVGAIVAIPAGLLIGSQFSSLGAKVLLIAIPIGALSGAGAGFLLGDLLAIPHYHYEPGLLSKGLQAYQDDEVNNMN